MIGATGPVGNMGPIKVGSPGCGPVGSGGAGGAGGPHVSEKVLSPIVATNQVIPCP